MDDIPEYQRAYITLALSVHFLGGSNFMLNQLSLYWNLV